MNNRIKINQLIVIALALVIAIVSFGMVSNPAFAYGEYGDRVIDYAGVFDDSELSELEDKLESFTDQTGIDLIFMFEENYLMDSDGEQIYEGSFNEYVKDIQEYFGYGASTGKAIMVGYSYEQDDFSIQSFGCLDDYDSEVMLDNVLEKVFYEYCINGMYKESVENTMETLQSTLTGYPRVLDFADLLSESEEEALEMRVEAFEKKEKLDMVLLLHDTITYGGAYEDFVADFNDYVFGYGEEDAIMFGVDMLARRYNTITSGEAEDKFPERALDSINGNFASKLKNAEYYDALNTYIDGLGSLTDGSYSKVKTKKRLIIIMPIALLLSAVATFFTALSQKKVSKKYEASEYIVPGSFNLINSSDRYSHTTRTMTKIESSSSGSAGSSGSSHGSSGGSF